eukprot:scaffold17149_cov120-Isochrysis_galbana.AAC.4
MSSGKSAGKPGVEDEYATAAAVDPEPPASSLGQRKGPADVILDAGEMAVVWDKGTPKAFGPQPCQISVSATQSWTKLCNTKASVMQYLEISKLDGSAEHHIGPANRCLPPSVQPSATWGCTRASAQECDADVWPRADTPWRTARTLLPERSLRRRTARMCRASCAVRGCAPPALHPPADAPARASAAL